MLPASANVTFESGSVIKLEPNFHAPYGSYFHARINTALH
jgi:hypothetical protein